MLNWVYKEKYIISNTFKKLPEILMTMLAIMGVVLTIAECVLWMFNSDVVYKWMHSFVWYILIGAFVISWLNNRIKISYEYFIESTDVKINLVISDILNCKGAIVIPTNSTFDTIMEDDFISINSVQGQYQKKIFNNNLHALDDLIEKGLKGCEFKDLNRNNSKKKRYPIGTVSKVTYSGVHYYFVAIADINEYGKPINTKFENIQLALEGIWRQLEDKGHIENLVIPLLGTGKAGIKDASREKVIKEIIFSFVASAKERKITEKLMICVHPADLAQKELKLKEIDEYLKYMCKYQYSNSSPTAEGNKED